MVWCDYTAAKYRQNLKLMYNNLSDAESIRWALLMGEYRFSEKRLSDNSWYNWNATGAVLQVGESGDASLYGTNALRYVGRMCNMYPADPLRALWVDEILDIIQDYKSCISTNGISHASVAQAEQRLDAAINRHKGSYTVGNEFTIADLYLASLQSWAENASGSWIGPRDDKNNPYDLTIAYLQKEQWCQSIRTFIINNEKVVSASQSRKVASNTVAGRTKEKHSYGGSQSTRSSRRNSRGSQRSAHRSHNKGMMYVEKGTAGAAGYQGETEWCDKSVCSQDEPQTMYSEYSKGRSY